MSGTIVAHMTVSLKTPPNYATLIQLYTSPWFRLLSDQSGCDLGPAADFGIFSRTLCLHCAWRLRC